MPSSSNTKRRPAKAKRKTSSKPARTGSAPAKGVRSAKGERLQKVLAAAGVASRRECEQLILEGRVEIDRQVVTKLGTCVDAETQQIRVDGNVLRTSRKIYFAVNKPEGLVSTSKDPWGRTRVIDMVPEATGRVFAVGRLDMASEGLMLLTNDGELANQLTHPRFGVAKTYEVQIAGSPETSLLASLRRGVRIAEGMVRVDQARIKKRLKKSSILEIVLREGKNREIRRMLAKFGHKVQRLRRVAIGPLRLGALPTGGVRMLESREIKRLHAAAAEAVAPAPMRKRPARKSKKPTGTPGRKTAKPAKTGRRPAKKKTARGR